MRYNCSYKKRVIWGADYTPRHSNQSKDKLQMATSNNTPPVIENQQEVWRDILGYEGIFQVSNYGQVRRIKGGQGVGKCGMLKLSLRKNGYFEVNLTSNNKCVKKVAHRLVATAFCTNTDPLKNEVNHINGIKTDNRSCNLEWVTRAENIAHAFSTGLMGGSKSRTKYARLTAGKVKEIKYLIKCGVEDIAISREFAISLRTVVSIRKDLRWIFVTI